MILKFFEYLGISKNFFTIWKNLGKNMKYDTKKNGLWILVKNFKWN